MTEHSLEISILLFLVAALLYQQWRIRYWHHKFNMSRKEKKALLNELKHQTAVLEDTLRRTTTDCVTDSASTIHFGFDVANLPPESPDSGEQPPDNVTNPAGHDSQDDQIGLFGESDGIKSDDQGVSRSDISSRGSHRDTHSQKSGGESSSRRGPMSRVDVICKREGWSWRVGLELPDNTEKLRIMLDNESIVPDHDETPFWILKRPRNVIVEWLEDEDEERFTKTLSDEFLIFKLYSKSLDKGRLVKNISRGEYAVFATEDWIPALDQVGVVTSEPEETEWQGYKVHFLRLEKGQGTQVAFNSGDGQSVFLPRDLDVVLVGNRIHDASEGVGPLVGDTLPELRATNVKTWEIIQNIVIGEEGPERRPWREVFQPKPSGLAQELPKTLLTRGPGWYFVRFYDATDTLLDSIDFRFVPGLKSIAVQHQPSNHEEGQRATTIIFQHDDGCIVRSLEAALSELVMRKTPSQTIASFHTKLDVEKCSWEISDTRQKKVLIDVDISSLRWGISDSSSLPTVWSDCAISLSRALFSPSAGRHLWLRFPRSITERKVLIGFEGISTAQYAMDSITRTLSVPLSDFFDSEVIRERASANLAVWISLSEESKSKHTIGILVRKRKRYRCKSPGHNLIHETTKDLLLHFTKSHDPHEYLRPLDNYEEFRKEYKKATGEDLPARIYRCGRCPVCSVPGSISGSLEVVYAHLKEHHPGEEHTIPYADFASIREFLFKSLPDYYTCSFCSCHFDMFEASQVWDHLMNQHLDRVALIEETEEEV